MIAFRIHVFEFLLSKRLFAFGASGRVAQITLAYEDTIQYYSTACTCNASMRVIDNWGHTIFGFCCVRSKLDPQESRQCLQLFCELTHLFNY